MRKWRTKELVDETEIEPATFPVGTGTLSRANCRSELQREFGGRDRDRTGDLPGWDRDALSLQLSE